MLSEGMSSKRMRASEAPVAAVLGGVVTVIGAEASGSAVPRCPCMLP